MFFKNNNTETIIILGLGGIGFYLAKRLVDEEYAVTIIEKDAKIIAKANQQIDARFIKGDGMSIDCWREAGAEDCDFLIAVTDNDSVNMIASLIAHKLGIGQKILRIRSHEFGKRNSVVNDRDLKVDLTIYPEELVAQEIVRLIAHNSGQEIITIADGQIEMLAAKIIDLSPWVYKKLKDIAQMHDFYFRVVAIARGIQTIIPNGDDEIQPNDHIYIMVRKKNLHKLMLLTDTEKQKQQRILILGGGLVGHRVAGLLEKSMQVTLLEKDETRANELATSLLATNILNGDGSDGKILADAGLYRADTIVAATGENETNIMSSLLAKHLIKQKKNKGEHKKKTKTISLVTKEDYLVLASSMGSDIALNKKVMAANEILKYIRKQEFMAVAHLHGFDAEVVELVAGQKSLITKKPLSKLDDYYQEKMIIGAVYQNDSWKIGIGDMKIEGEQRVIVICASKNLKIIRKLFSS
ncbi:MAG: Trk system potassium transporter TrkA [Desulfotalea sp.]